MTEPNTAQTYTGGCHCGRVRYQVTADLSRVISCNCSHCQKRGLLLAFTTPDQFSLTTGESELSDYQFNKKVIHHLFCSQCGIQSFAPGCKNRSNPALDFGRKRHLISPESGT